MYTYQYILICMHTNMYIDLYTNMYTDLYVCVHVYVLVGSDAGIGLERQYVHASTCISIHIHTRVYIHV